MFIQTEATPDPDRLKFRPGRQVLPEGTLEISDRKDAARSPLALKLFDVRGVVALSFGTDTITVTKDKGDWQHLKPPLLGIIMEHFMSGAPIVLAPAPSPRRAISAGEQVVVTAIRNALRLVIDPELGYNIVDLGLIYDVAVDLSGGVVIEMTTTTKGCPATNYLKEGAGDAATSVAGVEYADVRLTYEPPWSPEMMTLDAKRHLGMVDDGGW